MAAAKRFFAQPLTETTWFNAIWFQTTWFCAVLGRESLLPLTAALIALHIALVPNRGKELRQLAAVGAVGIGVDAFLSASGVFIFPHGELIPLWLCGLWLAFATTFTRSLAFLANKPLLAVLAGVLALLIGMDSGFTDMDRRETFAALLGCWLGDGAVAEARQVFRGAGIPDFDTPEEAVRAFSFLRTYRLHQEELLQTPPARSAARPSSSSAVISSDASHICPSVGTSSPASSPSSVDLPEPEEPTIANVSPCLISRSIQRVWSLVITGVETAKDSNITCPKFSPNVGKINTCCFEITFFISLYGIDPIYFTLIFLGRRLISFLHFSQ